MGADRRGGLRWVSFNHYNNWNINIVTFETAKRLKEAGFPQPELHDEQFWYNEQGNIVCFGHSVDNWGEIDYGVDVFAPTAIDIMLELGVEYVLWYDNGPKMTQWLCAKTGNTLREAGKPFLHKIAGEAAALAWLAAKSADNVRRPDDFDELGE